MLLLGLALPIACRRGGDEVVEKRATLISLKGSIKVKRAKSTEWIDAIENMPIGLNDKISSGENSFATLVFEGAELIRVDEKSLIAVTDVKRQRQVVGQALELDQGRVEVDVSSGREFRVKTRGAEAVVGEREITFQ